MSIEAELRQWITGSRFSCLGARSAVRRDVLRVVQPGRLAEPSTTAALHRAIQDFVHHDLSSSENFATLVAVFTGPVDLDEHSFDRVFWEQLQALHEVDAVSYTWADGVSDDPESPNFSLSLIGHPFFVVGMHPAASRISRRFRLPAVAFNSHHQFDRLRESGVYDGFKARIRARELALQKSLNVNLADFGEQSEACQYSGLPTDDTWRCPFHP